MSIENNPIVQDLKVAKIRLRALFRTRCPPGLLLCGPAGLGKTHMVRRIYRERFKQELAPFNGGSMRGFIDYMSKNRNGIVHFDDFDKVFFDLAFAEKIKHLLDSNEPRFLSHIVHGENSVLPFIVTAGVVFCSNLDFNNSGIWSARMWHAYIRPLKSRLSGGGIIRISFDPTAMLEYTLHKAQIILDAIKMDDPDTEERLVLSSTQKAEVMDHFKKYYANYPEHTPRIIHNLGLLRLGITDDADWELVRRRTLDDLNLEKLEREQEAATLAALEPEAA